MAPAAAGAAAEMVVQARTGVVGVWAEGEWAVVAAAVLVVVAMATVAAEVVVTAAAAVAVAATAGVAMVAAREQTGKGAAPS